jgi:AraC family transcriptional regulator of adaptative response/methylated-DNA-[protein]-cysteine methyltransferase
MSAVADATSGVSVEARYWHDVAARNAEADGLFWYGVVTTGIYCRPSCPSRAPRRENVRFFTSTAAAETAGFRACKRCHPDGVMADRNTRAIIKACRLIMAGGTPDLDHIATQVGMSRFHFQRTFKRLSGITPKAFADALRAGRLREALTADTTITEAIFAAGFNSSGRFYAAADAMLGMTAKELRAGADGLKIRFGLGQTTLGAILVAATGRGVCSILLGDDPDVLLQDLQQRFPRAELVGGDADFEQWMAVVIGFVEAPVSGLTLPLDIHGTVFQQRVWQALREIPPGHTASYAGIAARIGEPKAARAVARACAANPVAVAIPCHRVVRQDGGLSGYRWGVERKRALLAREAPETTDAEPLRTGG